MKRIKNSDINFKLNPKLIYIENFTIKFYTVNSASFFVSKNQDDVLEVERDATIYDEEVIASGGTKVTEYYIKLDWHDLQNIGEGVLNYRATNNVFDTGFYDTWYNRMVEMSTEYYIDSDYHIDPEDEKNIAEKLTELDERITIEVGDREMADTFISGAVDTEIARAISAETELSDRIDNLTSATTEAIDNEIARATSAETALQNALDAEVARATAIENAIRQDLTDESEIRSSADTAIWTAINEEVTRATSAETKIASDLSAESQRAITKEDAISGKLDTYIASNDAALTAEVNRATSAETQLSNSLNAEVTRATSTEQILSATIASNYTTLSTAIQNEETRSEAQETALNTKIDAEVTRATSVENAISGNLETYKTSNNAALQAEITRATSAETALSNRIDNLASASTAAIEAEEARAKEAESGLTLALQNEVTRATSAETQLSNNLNSEILRATSADTAIDNKIDAETLRATNTENAISGALETYKTSNNAALQAETTRATSAETKIASDLSNYISSNNHALADEVSRATTRENQIDTKLDNYIASNNSGVTALETALNSEILRATSAETSLSAYVDTRVEELIDGAPAALDTLKEIADKLKDQDDAVAAIISAVTEEASARTNADTALGVRIDNLTTATTAADAAEENRAKAAEAQITNALNNEVIRATSAETQLSNSLTAEITRATNKEDALDVRIDNLVTATTASDNAISGNLETYKTSNNAALSATNANVSANTSAINAEIARATSAETAIDTKVDNYIISNNTALQNEVNRATSAETALSGRIDVLTGVTDVIYQETIRASRAEEALSGAIDSLSAITSGDVQDLEAKVNTLSGTVTAHTADTSIHFTTGTVQSLIDSSISGKANSSDVYLKSETSGATELATAFAAKQDQLIAGENITISGNVISASDGTVDGTSLFGGTHHTNEGTSIKYFNQLFEGQKPSALKFVVAYGNNTYSSAITITLYDTQDYNEHHNTLTISSSGGAVTSITEANGGSFTGITVDDDWVLRPAEGYFFNSYQWLINNNVLGLRILPKDATIESGSTTDVIENGIYKQLKRHEENIGNLSLSAVTSTKLSFKDESGITLTTNASSTALAVDDSLKYIGKLGVYVTGDTYTDVLNSESATTYINLDGKKNVDMWLNQSYTGTPSGWYTISVLNLENSYDYYLYENDAFTLVGGSAGSTLNYDSSTGKVSITCPSGILYIINSSKFAPANDLTNADCFIGLASYTSNEYPLQKVIDNLLDYIDTLKNNNLDKLTAEYDSETDTWYLGGGEY